MIRASVVVPVFNPGAHIDDCIASLVGQSLPTDEYEAIFVDDGSTDGTGERLDALAAEHPHVRVAHIPNSGWPGRPRNVGLDMAHGEFVLFADNDDYLEPDALERLLAMAMQDEADIVIGKVVGHGKYVPPALFARNLHNVSLRDAPLVSLLSPHKLFRRSFLEAHGLRFPEGRRRLEDHVFVLQAYFATDRTSVLADHPCYHWMRRGKQTASSAEWDPVPYYEAVREVLDIVDANTEPGALRDRLYMRWYRGKTLGRLGGYRSALTWRSPEWRRAVFAEVRRIVDERFGEHLDARLPFGERIRAALVRAGDFDAVLALARFEHALVARPVLRRSSTSGRDVELELSVQLASGGAPLRYRRAAGRLLWDAPPAVAAHLPEGVLDATEDLERSTAKVFARAVRSKAQHVLPTTTEIVLDETPDGHVEPRLVLRATLRPATAAAGSALRPGGYDHPVIAHVGGFAGEGVARRARGLPPLATRVSADGGARVRVTTARAAALGLARRMPRLARAAKRAGGR